MKRTLKKEESEKTLKGVLAAIKKFAWAELMPREYHVITVMIKPNEDEYNFLSVSMKFFLTEGWHSVRREVAILSFFHDMIMHKGLISNEPTFCFEIISSKNQNNFISVKFNIPGHNPDIKDKNCSYIRSGKEVFLYMLDLS